MVGLINTFHSTTIIIAIRSNIIMIAIRSKIIITAIMIVFEAAAAPLTGHPSLALHHRGDPTKVKFEAVVMVVVVVVVVVVVGGG